MKLAALCFVFFTSLSFAGDGRITVVSGNDAPENDVTTSAVYLTYPVELSLQLNASAHLAGKNYDVFEITYGGAPMICSGPAWVSNTIRSAEVVRFGDEIVNSGAMICFNGTLINVAAGEAKLRGGFRSFANGQTRSTRKSRLVWDARKPILWPVAALETASTWSYGSDVFRQVNGNPGNQIEIFNGMSGRPVDVTASAYMIGSGGLTSGFVGIGLDTSVADSSHTKNPCAGSNVFPVLPCWARYSGYVGIGYHEIRWLERGTGSAITWVGSNGYPGYGYSSGLIGFVIQ
jgi:hypothetical protein